MNRRDANLQSEQNTRNIVELRALIDGARQRGGMSRVNPALTMDQVCGIYWGALEGRDPNEVPKGMRYDVYRRRDVASKDSLIIRNILRDCA